MAKRRKLLTRRRDGWWVCRRQGATLYWSKDRQEAERLYLEWEQRQRRPGPDPSRTTLLELAEGVLEAKSNLATSTIAAYRRELDRVRAFFGDSRVVDTITAGEWFRYRDHLEKDVAVKTFHGRLLSLRSALTAAEERGWITEVKRLGLKLPTAAALRRDRGQKRRHYEPREVLQLLKAAEGDDVMQLWIWLGVTCGFGPADISALKPEHVGDRFITFPRPKTGVPRRCPVVPEVSALLERVELPMRSAKGLELVRVLKSGRHGQSARSAIAKPFKELCEKAGVTCLGHYGLRHTFAVIGARTGDIDAVKAVMGHVHTGVTTLYTGAVDDGRLLKVVTFVRESIVNLGMVQVPLSLEQIVDRLKR